MPFGANDLACSPPPTRRSAWIADAPLPPRDKAPVDYSVEESIIKRARNLRISRQTLKTSPRSRQGMRSPAGRETLGGAGPGPYILFPNAGVATGQRAGLLLRAAALRLPQPA